MFIILGATGHVGSGVAETLLRGGHGVTVVTRDPAKARHLEQMGARIAVADIYDVASMCRVFRSGRRLFLLNPPAAPDTDTNQTELATVRHLLAALDGAGLERVVAQSTYGAQPGDELGDLSTLYALEEGLDAQTVPHSIIRAAYFMTNWDTATESAREEGLLPTMIPADLKLPMVAPADLGAVAVRLLTSSVDQAGVHYVEGPERYSPTDVALAFAQALDQPVRPVVTPREQWEATYRGFGFSEAAARSYTRMTAISVDGGFEMPDDPIRGSVTLQTYIDALVAKT